MPQPIVVSTDPTQVQVKPGEECTAIVIVRNRMEEVEHYVLKVENLPEGWAEVAPDQVSAFPLGEARSQVTIHPPTGAQGATYPVIVRATSQERPEVDGWASLELRVLAGVVPPAQQSAVQPPRVEREEPRPVAPRPPTEARPEPRVEPRPITADQIQVGVEPVADPNLAPPAARWRIALRNAGTVLDTFSFNLSGIRPEWVSMDPTQVTLKPDERGTALLTIRPSAHTPAGAYPFVLRVFSQLNVSQRTEVALTVDIQARAGFAVSVSPPETEAQGLREFRVSLASDANSNTDLEFDLSASDPENGCEYTFEPSQLVLRARQSATSTLRVRPRASLGPHERRTYTFQVVATPRQGLAPAKSAQARLTQVSMPPPTLELRPQVQSGELQAQYTLLIANPSAVELALRLAAADPEAGCSYRFDSPRIAVPPRGQAQARLAVAARGYVQAEKSIPFTLSATREGELVPVATAEGRFVQRPVSPVTLSLVPPQQSRTGSARYFVKAVNPRSLPVRVWLEGRDEADAVSFSFKPPEIHLSAGAEGGAWLTARPKDKLLVGEQRRVHRFQVTGQVEGLAEPLIVAGTLAQVRGLRLGGGLKVLVRLAKWAVALIIVIFIVALALAGMETLADVLPQAGGLFGGVLDSSIARLILRLPFAAPARTIVRWLRELAFLIGNVNR